MSFTLEVKNEIKKLPKDGDDKKEFLKRNNIAMWDVTGRPAICLPSKSPANAAWTMEKLIAAWKVIREIPQDKA